MFLHGLCGFTCMCGACRCGRRCVRGSCFGLANVLRLASISSRLHSTSRVDFSHSNTYRQLKMFDIKIALLGLFGIHLRHLHQYLYAGLFSRNEKKPYDLKQTGNWFGVDHAYARVLLRVRLCHLIVSVNAFRFEAKLDQSCVIQIAADRTDGRELLSATLALVWRRLLQHLWFIGEVSFTLAHAIGITAQQKGTMGPCARLTT